MPTNQVVAEWHYLGPAGPVGPVPENELRALLRSGTLPSETPVWRGGPDGWRPASEVLPTEPPQRLRPEDSGGPEAPGLRDVRLRPGRRPFTAPARVALTCAGLLVLWSLGLLVFGGLDAGPVVAFVVLPAVAALVGAHRSAAGRRWAWVAPWPRPSGSESPRSREGLGARSS